MLADWLFGVLVALSPFAAANTITEDILPPPRPTERIRIDDLRPVHFFYRPDPYWRARLYAPNRFGEYRPRVIHGPYGSYWPLTGEPYLFTSVRGIQ